MRVVVLPDFQVPDEDPVFVEHLIRFVRDYVPDVLVHVGDFLDAKPPARWSKATAAEFAGTLQGDVDRGVKVLEKFRAVYDGPFRLKTGNHDERIATYLRKYAPALSSLRELRLERLLNLDRLDISLEPRPFDITPGWVVAHGHEGSLIHTAGGTALSLARKFGRSVVCGHTHRAGIQHDHDTINGRIIRSIFGMEVGHAMLLRKAHYLKAGAANWQQAFGMLHVHRGVTTPQLVLAHRGEFTVEGVRYGRAG